MDRRNFKYPSDITSGAGTFSDDLVGFQLVQGGGLTQGNFSFTTNITEKVNRQFSIGSFSKPITLDTLKLESLTESRILTAKEFRVYPNFDLSEITKFSLYGSLVKRISSSVERIINYFPAALEIFSLNSDYTKTVTCYNSSFDSEENITTFDVLVDKLRNPFGIDYSVGATRNLSLRENQVSELRNLTTQYFNYSLFLGENEYQVIYFQPSDSLYSGYLRFTVQGNPFSGQSTSTSTLVIRPNSFFTEKSFTEPFDEVEEFLLNRLVMPKYTATFVVPKESNDGVKYNDTVSLTWPLAGIWNLDISTISFTNYLKGLNEVAAAFDEQKTNLIVRFLTTDAVKEFDTDDQRMQKMLNIYGRSFDDVKKFIDSLAHMTSVNYVVKNDIPSQLLKNLAATLGWQINISPTQNEDFLNSIFGGGKSQFSGYDREQTPNELNYQFYRNLIMNSAYLFKSKGTRKSIETLLRLVGAPEALIEFNEHIYIAGQRISLENFEKSYAEISGGTLVEEVPVLTNSKFSIRGVKYSSTTTELRVSNVDTILEDYPIDVNGYPKRPRETEDFFFQKGAGWFELVKNHQSPQIIDYTNSVFTGQNFDVQTEFERFTYGQKYLDRFRKFPYMNLGFSLFRIPDNKKSWPITDINLRVGNPGSNYNAYYFVSDENLVLNVKNVELFLNPAQGLLYDVWYMSNKYDYPIPCTGITTPYPTPNSPDWTYLNPEPCKKSFFEFAQTFWLNAVNVRDRLYSSLGNSSGYPTLQSIFWKYLQSNQTVGIPNNNFNYKSMVDYVTGLGDYWIRLVEQMIPASTIWIGGVKYENSIFHRQKFVYRIQRGCRPIPIPCYPCSLNGQLFNYDCTDEEVNCYIYPWDTESVESFKDVLYLTADNYAISNKLVCDYNSLITDWYVEVILDNVVVLSQYFYTGYGLFDVPTNEEYKDALQNYVPSLSNQYLNYFLNGDYLYVSNAGCTPNFTDKQVQLRIGMDFKLSCD